MLPTYIPTDQRITDVTFQYILGFDDPEINASQFISDSNGFKSSVEGAIESILSGAGLHFDSNRQLLRVPKSRDGVKRVKTLGAEDIDCPSSFSVSDSCILPETEVRVRIKEHTNNVTKNEMMLLDPIEKSMKSPLFLNAINRQEIKEVYFVGAQSEVEYQKPSRSGKMVIIAGISIGAILFLSIYFISRQQKGKIRFNSELFHELSSERENTRDLKVSNFPIEVNECLPRQMNKNNENEDQKAHDFILNLGQNNLQLLQNDRLVDGFSDSPSSSSGYGK